MSKETNLIARKTMIAAAALAISTTACCLHFARADDMKMGDKKMSADEMKMVTDSVDKMKKEAADSSDAAKLKTSMAKEMVMEKMAMTMAHDPQFNQETMDLMNDANVKKVHDEAKTMAEDPAEMKKMKDEIMADPKEMKSVMHHAMMMDMMMSKMGDKSDSGSDSMTTEGKKMMDKMRDKN